MTEVYPVRYQWRHCSLLLSPGFLLSTKRKALRVSRDQLWVWLIYLFFHLGAEPFYQIRIFRAIAFRGVVTILYSKTALFLLPVTILKLVTFSILWLSWKFGFRFIVSWSTSSFSNDFINTVWVAAFHYSDVIMGATASQITSLTIVFSAVYSDADQRKHQSSTSPAFVRGIHRGLVNSPHKWPVTRKMFPFDDVIMELSQSKTELKPIKC